jgi:hypothetical protein
MLKEEGTWPIWRDEPRLAGNICRFWGRRRNFYFLKALPGVTGRYQPIPTDTAFTGRTAEWPRKDAQTQPSGLQNRFGIHTSRFGLHNCQRTRRVNATQSDSSTLCWECKHNFTIMSLMPSFFAKDGPFCRPSFVNCSGCADYPVACWVRGRKSAKPIVCPLVTHTQHSQIKRPEHNQFNFSWRKATF